MAPADRVEKASASARGRAAGWGGVARRGAGNVRAPGPEPARGSSSAAWRAAVDREADVPDRWVDDGPVRAEAAAAVGRAGQPPRRSRALPEDVGREVAAAAPAAWAGRVKDRLAEAADAYEAERYRDARRILEGLLERAPGSLAIRELYGLTLYRLGRWRDAARELGAVETLGGGVDHHPVLADCHRALGHHDRVMDLWDELRRAGAGVEVLVEGRIVTAGSLADRGDLDAAIRLLEQGPTKARRPQLHHLRLWYALADLRERAGDPVGARAGFERIVAASPDFADAAQRLASLR